MNTAELARVSEVTPFRVFEVVNDNDSRVHRVVYEHKTGKLRCYTHMKVDSCTCCSRVKLSGYITGFVRGVKRREAENGVGATAPASRPVRAEIGSEIDAILGPPMSEEEMNRRHAANEARAKEIGL